MTMTDPIADMLTRIRNGIQARHPSVEMPSSTVKVAIAEVLRDEGYIKGFAVSGEGWQKKLKVDLKYADKNEPIVTGIKRVSKPGLRVYAGANAIPRVYGGLGISILSTSRGVMSGARARRERVGGEVIAHVW
jgi:small subunit ribosomal protein S8